MTTRSWTTLELLKTTTDFLKGKERPSPRLAAERLLARALGCKRVDLYLATDKLVGEDVLETYRGYVRAYAAGTPLQYVEGEVEFMGLGFEIDSRVLIPRPETELLVDAVEKRLPAAAGPAAILELGTGSGAVAVSLAVRLPHVEVWTTEASPEAARLAHRNAALHGVTSRVHVLVMDRFEALHADLAGTMACIVSNPPYVTTSEMATLPELVRLHEPHAALHGGPDGLDFHRYLCTQGLQFLAPGGTLATEIGAGQGEAARRLFTAAGLDEVTVLADYAGFDRIVLGRK